jgi:hypothetical protein
MLRRNVTVRDSEAMTSTPSGSQNLLRAADLTGGSGVQCPEPGMTWDYFHLGTTSECEDCSNYLGLIPGRV